MATPLVREFRPEYHQLHRVGRPGLWRSLVGVLLVVGLMLLVIPALAGVAAFALLALQGNSVDEATAQLDLATNVTPAGLALVNVVLGLGIPVVWFVTWLLHRLKPGWVSSIAPKLRWKFLFACVGLSIVALIASIVVSALVPSSSGVAETTVEINSFTNETLTFLIVIALLTPFQAAAEEYVFRGYFTQAFGSLFAHPVVSRALAITVPALLFALAHGSQEPPVFIDRFAFGLVAGILVIRTGGLEAAIAMHVFNNFFAFGLALMLGDMTETLNASMPASWWMIASTLTQSLVYLALASWVAKAMKLERRGPAVGAPVLAPPTARV